MPRFEVGPHAMPPRPLPKPLAAYNRLPPACDSQHRVPSRWPRAAQEGVGRTGRRQDPEVLRQDTRFLPEQDGREGRGHPARELPASMLAGAADWNARG